MLTGPRSHSPEGPQARRINGMMTSSSHVSIGPCVLGARVLPELCTAPVHSYLHHLPHCRVGTQRFDLVGQRTMRTRARIPSIDCREQLRPVMYTRTGQPATRAALRQGTRLSNSKQGCTKDPCSAGASGCNSQEGGYPGAGAAGWRGNSLEA